MSNSVFFKTSASLDLLGRNMSDEKEKMKEKRSTRGKRCNNGASIVEYYTVSATVTKPTEETSALQNGDKSIHKKLEDVTKILETAISNKYIDKRNSLFEGEDAVLKEKALEIDKWVDTMNQTLKICNCYKHNLLVRRIWMS